MSVSQAQRRGIPTMHAGEAVPPPGGKRITILLVQHARASLRQTRLPLVSRGDVERALGIADYVPYMDLRPPATQHDGTGAVAALTAEPALVTVRVSARHAARGGIPQLTAVRRNWRANTRDIEPVQVRPTAHLVELRTRMRAGLEGQSPHHKVLTECPASLIGSSSFGWEHVTQRPSGRSP